MTLNYEKLITHIFADAKEDLDVARCLLHEGRIRHGMLLAHLAVEKALKALVMQAIHSAPPKVQELGRLAELAGLQLDQGMVDLLSIMDHYGLAGRYLELPSQEIELAEALSDFDKVNELFEQLTSQPISCKA